MEVIALIQQVARVTLAKGVTIMRNQRPVSVEPAAAVITTQLALRQVAAVEKRMYVREVHQPLFVYPLVLKEEIILEAHVILDAIQTALTSPYLPTLVKM